MTIPTRKPIRLAGYDYSWNGLYFVTICCKDRVCYFGNIISQTMFLNELGKIAEDCWNEIPKHFPCVLLHAYIIMPNHVHGIIEIQKDKRVEDLFCTKREFGKPQKATLSTIVSQYKSAVSKTLYRNNLSFSWQARFHDHIIRTEKSYNVISEYIKSNPSKWHEDRFFIP